MHMDSAICHLPSAIGLDREDILAACARIMAETGASQNRAAVLLGVPSASISRWRKLYAAGGLAALADQRAGKCGRKPLAVLDECETLEAKRLYIQTDSKTSALRQLASQPGTRPEVADAINKKRTSKHTITRALRDQIEIPSAVINYHKSPKNVRVNCFINSRTMTYIDALGTEKRLTPGDLFERDDMSNNFLCWVPWPWGGDPCSDKYGVRVARGQNLLMIDVASLFFTSFNFLVRLRDSYRADDIWQWIGQTYRDIGKPRIGERWERGTWASKRLRGDRDIPIEAGHTPDDVRLGGMRALGLRVIESQSPTTKIIENRFNFLQTQCQTIRGQIGRKRGEMERETKIWTACRLGHRDPRDYFLSFEQASDAIEEKLHYVNSEPVEGMTYHGIPAQKWAEGMAAAPLIQLGLDEGYLFARDRREITARKGHIMVRYQSPEGHRAAWWYHHPELYKAEGMKVAVYFDHYAPAAGATLVHMEGRHIGQTLGHAEMVSGCPQFSLSADEQRPVEMTDALDRKGAFLDAVRSEYRSLGLAGRRIAKAARVDDGRGREASVDWVAHAPSRAGAGASPVPSEVPGEGAGNNVRGARATQTSRVQFDETAELDRIAAAEAEAIRRGDLAPIDTF